MEKRKIRNLKNSRKDKERTDRPGKVAQGLKRAGLFLRRHLKMIIFLLILLAIILTAWSYLSKNREKSAAAMGSAIKTAQVEKRTITNSISLTGSVASAESKTVTTTLTGVEVCELHVKKGDTVAAGDVLLKFDTTDIEEDMETAREDLSQSRKSAELAKQGADRELAYTTDSQLSAVEKAAKAIQDAEADLADACDAYGDAKSSFSTLEDVAAGKKSAYEAAQEAYNNAKSVSSNSVAATTADGTVTEEELSAAQEAVADAESEVSKAQAAYESAKTEYETAKKNAETAESKVTTASSTEKNAQKSYESAVEEQESTAKSSANTILSQQESYEKTMLTLDDDVEELENQLKDYERQLEKYTVCAPISGTVTEVNAEEGSAPSSQSLITIEDCQGFTVTAEVDEYDISDIEEGMKVVIKTDATGDEELEGVITYISPTPSSSSEGSADVTYEITVEILSSSDRLRLGMTAKLSIILESRENVLTVPYNCIVENENGESVVYVLDSEQTASTGSQKEQQGIRPQEGGLQDTTGSGEQTDRQPPEQARKAVVVETGLESDYYVEVISSELEEGVQVVIPSDESESRSAGDSGTENTLPGGMSGGIGGMGGAGRPGGF